MSIKEDFNAMKESIKMVDEQMGFLNMLIENSITSVHNLDLKIREGLEKIHFDKILSMTDDEVRQFLIDNAEPNVIINANAVLSGKDSLTETEPSESNIRALEENHKTAPDGWSEKPFWDYARYVLKSIKDSMMEINKLEADKEKLLKNMHEIEDDYFSYVNTAEYKENKMKKLQSLKDSIDQEPDEVKRAQIKRNIEAMEKAETLDFLYDQINQKGPRELDNIVNSYFDHNRSSLIMTKFSSRIPKFGYNKDLYKFFFNLEENFLPEEYHVFNNFFLFHVMRTISYMDINSKTDNLYTSTILVRMYNLVYHKYGDQALEDEFIEFIRKFDEMFLEKYTEKFEKDNITHPKHPERIEKDAKNEKRRRIMTIAELQNYGIDPDTSLSTDELVELLKNTIEEKEAAKKSELEDWNSVNSPEENSEENPDATSGYAEFTPVEDTIESDGEPEPGEQIGPSDMPPVMVATEGEVTENELLAMADSENNKLDSSEEKPEESDDSQATTEQVGAIKIADEPKGIDMSSLIGEPLTPVSPPFGTIMPHVTVYFDKHGYYYIKNASTGTYDYYTPDHKIYESGFSEEDILKLINIGALDKGFLTI